MSHTARYPLLALLYTAGNIHTLHLALADHFISRFRGLMLAPPLQENQGLLLTACSSIHTAFMRYAIDVIYLDHTGQILKCVPSVKPWRGSISHAGKYQRGRHHMRAAHTLELAAGAIMCLGIGPGDRLEWRKSL